MNGPEHGRAVLDIAAAALDSVAARRVDAVRTFAIGPTTVSLHTTDRTVGLEPFSHLPTVTDPAATPDLVVHLCDGDLPGAPGGRPPRGFDRVRDDDHFVALTDAPPTLEAVRMSDRVALSWVDAFPNLPAHTRHRPLAEIFAAWFPTRGMLLLHAAAVGDASGAVLLVGHGGSGKSTTAVVCAQAGMGFVADDFCLLEPGPPARVHSIHRTAKLRPPSTHVHPDVEAAPPDADGGDRYLLVDEATTVVSAPVRAIVAVSPVPGDRVTPRLARVPEDDVVQLLLPTALKLAEGGDEAFRLWMRAAHGLARTVDAYSLELTWDTDGVAGHVDEVLRNACARAGVT